MSHLRSVEVSVVWLGWALVACDDTTTTTKPTDSGSDTPIDSATTDSGTTMTDSGTTTDTTDPPVPLKGCFSEYEFDYEDDGTVDAFGFDQYDDVDNALLVYQERTYSPIFQIPDVAVSYAYDANGYLTLYEQDSGIDGTVDYRVTQTWDATGLLLTYTQDVDGDKTLDYTVSFTYDKDGTRLTAEADEDGDGTVDVWWTYGYDKIGRQTLIEGDDGNDGVADRRQTTTYTDPKLEIGETVVDDPIGDAVEYISTFERDAEGRTVYQQDDDGADGVIDFTYTAEYDPVTGTLTESTIVGIGAPPYDVYVFRLTDSYDYDPSNRLIEHFQQSRILEPFMSPLPDQRETWLFGGDCP